MAAHTPTRRLFSASEAVAQKHPELGPAVNEMVTAICAHAAYVHDALGLVALTDALREELTKENVDRGATDSIIGSLVSSVRKGEGDARQVMRVETAAQRLRDALR